MHSKRVLRTTIISFILIISLLLPTLIITPTISADSTEGTTTLYFHDILETEGIMDENLPTKDNDSEWPPRIWNSESWLYWATILATSFLFNESDLELDPLSSLFLDPYTVWGMYINEGNSTLKINGDIVFDLYFKSTMIPDMGEDEVQVSLYWFDLGSLFDFDYDDFDSELDFFEEINVTTKLKRDKFFDKIQEYKVTIENVSISLIPDTMLIFSVRIIPGIKPLGRVSTFDRIIPKILGIIPGYKAIKQGLINWTLNRGNSSRFELVKIITEAIQVLRETIEMSNITKDDVGDLVNGFRAPYFIYDSIDHPSSVIVPFTSPGETGNKYVYYLHEGNIMDEIEPTEDTEQTEKITKDPLIWEGPDLERSKILKAATAKLYIGHKDLLLRFLNFIKGKIKITATLYDNNTKIASSEQQLSRTNIFQLFNKPQIPVKFTFNNFDYEIVHGDNINLEISISNGTRLATLPYRRSATLFYDSTQYLSSLSLQFEDTDHIKMNLISNPSDEEIVPGGSVKYTLGISSKYDDDISVDVTYDNKDDWKVTIIDKKIDISSGDTAETYVFVNSTEKSKDAYGNSIDLTFVAGGKTGIARKETSVEISEDAIEYDVNIIGYTKSKNIKPGKSGTFYFIIENNNTGADDDVDSYSITATSQRNWEIKKTDSIDNLGIGEKTGSTEILVAVSVPENTSAKSDTITFTVTSKSDSKAFATVNVTVDVISPTFLESIYEFFETTSESIGLDEVFGTSAPYALAGIIVIIILLIIIILAFLLIRKTVNIVCTERIKEIDPDGKASFKITIENPTKKTKTYEVTKTNNPSSPKWEKSVDTEKITINGRQSKTVILTVKPTDVAEPRDWTETKLKVKVPGKRKSKEITTMTMIKDGKTLLKISDVFTWPKDFTEGSRLTTSFKLMNKGNITARNVKAILYINGKEKNKTDVTIPSGGYANIRMPWIAYKGKNKLYIKAKEQ